MSKRFKMTAAERKVWKAENPRYQRPPDQVCAHCGARVPGSDLGLLSQAIQGHKPVCSYECNKALGQVE